MALQVWLPLNGNLNNQGLSDITVTNNGATVDNNGKIGKCYSFGTSTSYLTLSNNTMNECTTECSLSFWLNITSWNKSYATFFQAGLGGTPWDNYIFGILRNNTSSNLCFTISNGSSASNASYTTPDLELNTWYHLTFVYKTGHCLIYINGELYKDYATTIVPNFSGITKTTVGVSNNTAYYQTNCKINDLRVYNRTLSPKEIEILSRGLVLHYPLNNNGGGQPNLYNFESVASLWQTGSEELIFVDATDDVYGNVLKIIVDSVRIYRGVRNVWKADTNFTVSFLAKASKTAVLKIERGRTDYAPDVTVGTTWKRYSTVISCTDTTTGGALGITSDTAGADIYLTQIKVELGDKATAYCPGVGDSHYIPMGYDSTTEYDVSGYGYNGTKVGSPTYSSDTPRYSISTSFNGVDDCIQVPLNTFFPNAGTFTINLWFKKHELGSKNYETVFGGISGFEIDTRNNTSTTLSYYVTGSNRGLTVQSPLNLDTWYMLTMVCDGTNELYYVNGEYKKQIEKKNMPTGNYFIGAWRDSVSQNFKGLISDFRVYSTALTATQVAELYNTAISISNNGALLGYELVEV